MRCTQHIAFTNCRLFIHMCIQLTNNPTSSLQTQHANGVQSETLSPSAILSFGEKKMQALLYYYFILTAIRLDGATVKGTVRHTDKFGWMQPRLRVQSDTLTNSTGCSHA